MESTPVLNLAEELRNVTDRISIIRQDLDDLLGDLAITPSSVLLQADALENAVAAAFWLTELGKLHQVQAERAASIQPDEYAEGSPEREAMYPADDDYERCNDCGADALSPECCKSQAVATVDHSVGRACKCRPADGGHSAHSFALMMMAEMTDGDHQGDLVTYNGERATIMSAYMSGPFFSLFVQDHGGQFHQWRPSPTQTTVARRSGEWILTTLEEPCPCGWM